MSDLDAATAESLLSMPVAMLAAEIRRGTFKAVDVLHVFKARMLKIDHACNAVVDWSPYAEEEAKYVDEYRQRTGLVLGPLHGVPCSVKDSLRCKGMRIRLNMMTFKDAKPNRTDEPLAAQLRGAGAIIVCKTLPAQMNNTWGSGGPLHGDCLNPWDTLRSPAGSSCGEGALIGGGASPFGIGSDIGGSVRLPSSNCGICTLKPTCGRISELLESPGRYSVVGTYGVMAKTVDDVSTVFSVLLGDALFSGESRIPPIPFHHVEFSSVRPLRVAYYTDILGAGYPGICPTARRAIEDAVAGLKRRGHQVFLFELSNAKELETEARTVDASFRISVRPPRDSDESYRIQKRTGPPRDSVQGAKDSFASWVSPDEIVHPDLAANFKKVEDAEHDAMHATFVHTGRTHNGSSTGYEQLMGRRDEIRNRFYSEVKKSNIDVLLGPTIGIPSVYVEDYVLVSHIQFTTRFFNVMDMPAGHVTTTLVTKQDIAQPWDLKTEDEKLRKAVKRSFENGEGMPMGVQVAALPFKEELCLRAMREVAAAVPFAGGHTKLSPVPRRTPSLGARPEPIGEAAPKSRL